MTEESINNAEKLSVKVSSPSWTNRSVITLAQGKDPIETIIRFARAIILDAIEDGWQGPPFDPFQLANRMGIEVMPRDDIPDARLVPIGSTHVCIEFNPDRPSERLRFSVAHELAHTLFPDHAETMRMRGQPHGDEWQMELLCNIAAAEFLMPIGTAIELEKEAINIENLITLQKKYDVSAEALFLRMVKLTREKCAVFAAARISNEKEPPIFRIDYTIPSRSWSIKIFRGLKVKESKILSECTAVGFTSRGYEKWSPNLSELNIECMGIPAYPGDLFPRIIGVFHTKDGTHSIQPQLTEVYGDATQPRGSGRKVIAHIVNDRTPNWGGFGFAKEVKMKWRTVQEDFISWTKEQRGNLTLGNVHVTEVSDELSVFHMIAQHGYGPSPKPRVRYLALKKCLDKLADYALEKKATVHMPRIGTGYAGGQWSIIRELIDDTLIVRRIEVIIYSLPDTEPQKMIQLVFSSKLGNPEFPQWGKRL